MEDLDTFKNEESAPASKRINEKPAIIVKNPPHPATPQISKQEKFPNESYLKLYVLLINGDVQITSPVLLALIWLIK